MPNKYRSDSWKKLKITEKYLQACKEMAEYSVSEKTIIYWQRCAQFLEQLKRLQYEMLTIKQRNWVFSIKSDLESEGLV